MTAALLHPGDLGLTFWLLFLLVAVVAALAFAALLALFLRMLLSRRGPSRPARRGPSERQA